jgi:hypothetical protein
MQIITSTELGNNGRLGNQLFQMAACFGIGASEKAAVILPEWSYLDCFKNKQLIVTATASFPPVNVYREESFSYSHITLDSFVKNKTDTDFNAIFGYFQSEKYFKHIDTLIRRLFEPSEEIRQKLLLKYEPILSKKTCSIHVRRGDYVNNPFYEQLNVNYYDEATLVLEKKTNVDCFLIFSDDIQWCKDNFKHHKCIFIEGNTDIEDLFLMSFCNHNIGANSSFSWWGAWLNPHKDKINVFPKKWFGNDVRLETKDLYLPAWITI